MRFVVVACSLRDERHGRYDLAVLIDDTTSVPGSSDFCRMYRPYHDLFWFVVSWTTPDQALSWIPTDRSSPSTPAREEDPHARAVFGESIGTTTLRS
jgi:hypothetical protein